MQPADSGASGGGGVSKEEKVCNYTQTSHSAYFTLIYVCICLLVLIVGVECSMVNLSDVLCLSPISCMLYCVHVLR